ncbi:hypothetical protein LK540_11950 [Massilia sp. IC2-278]|uniref:hypothetical protein n=1 Tax=Massilia sp. IC2-278 TaxID=2887200 RepID=UPI001E2B9E9C|nr:hypothetical protein [Massilia sp. IC2-278]MCC2961134.1 hypothetical protein [Massilia sp. IC2-278]
MQTKRHLRVAFLFSAGPCNIHAPVCESATIKAVHNTPIARIAMPSQPDLTVYSSDHQLQLVVEIKRVSGKGPEWAAELHRNLLEYHAVPPSPFFLLVLPDHLYLWSTQQGEDAYLPQYEAVTTSALKKYLPKKAHYSSEITELGLQLAVQFWLSELTNPNATPDAHEYGQWVMESGLFAAIRRGSVQIEAVV